MEVRAIVVALLGQGASGKEQTGQGTERQRKSPAWDELTFRGQRNTPRMCPVRRWLYPIPDSQREGTAEDGALGTPTQGCLEEAGEGRRRPQSGS